MKGIIHYQTEEYGCIKVKLSGVLKSLGITRNQLRTLTGVKYEVIDRYYKGEDIYMADLNFLAKVCYSLECKIEDLLEYCPPNNENKGYCIATTLLSCIGIAKLTSPPGGVFAFVTASTTMLSKFSCWLSKKELHHTPRYGDLPYRANEVRTFFPASQCLMKREFSCWCPSVYNTKYNGIFVIYYNKNGWL